MKSCEVVWVIRDDSICRTFVDEGAAVFFLPHLLHDDREETGGQRDTAGPLKRVKYVCEREEESNRGVASEESTAGSERRGRESAVGSALGPDWQTGRQMKGTIEVTSHDGHMGII